jgi:endonuclease IV
LSIAENSFSILQAMIDTCRHKNIKLIFTHSAEYMQINEKKYSNYESLMDSLLTISKANNIVYLRHDTIGMCTQKKYFKNVGHLNKSGADTYTKVLADDFLLKRN